MDAVTNLQCDGYHEKNQANKILYMKSYRLFLQPVVAIVWLISLNRVQPPLQLAGRCGACAYQEAIAV